MRTCVRSDWRWRAGKVDPGLRGCRHPHGTGSNRAGFARMTSQPVTPALFDFLCDLKTNNERQAYVPRRGPCTDRSTAIRLSRKHGTGWLGSFRDSSSGSAFNSIKSALSV